MEGHKNIINLIYKREAKIMYKIIENNSQKFPVFYLVNSVSGELIRECYSRAEAEKAKAKAEREANIL